MSRELGVSGYEGDVTEEATEPLFIELAQDGGGMRRVRHLCRGGHGASLRAQPTWSGAGGGSASPFCWASSFCGETETMSGEPRGGAGEGHQGGKCEEKPPGSGEGCRTVAREDIRVSPDPSPEPLPGYLFSCVRSNLGGHADYYRALFCRPREVQ